MGGYTGASTLTAYTEQDSGYLERMEMLESRMRELGKQLSSRV